MKKQFLYLICKIAVKKINDMGQESLEKLNIYQYRYEWEKKLLEETDKQYLKDHFKIGCGEDNNKVRFYKLYLKTFDSTNCELSNWIWKKINGFFEDPEINKKGEVQSLKYQPIQNITNIYGEFSDWKKVEW